MGIGVVTLALSVLGPVHAQEVEVDAPEGLAPTPSQAEGPYYPVELPADRDADLTFVEGAASVASGQPMVLQGVLLTAAGVPVQGAVIEIWQTDAGGVYLHPGDPGYGARDVRFQGYGESPTDRDGRWAFRTILPEVYGGRPRHIHAKVTVAGDTALTTQIYFAGGDVPADGAVALSGAETDALIVEPRLEPDSDGSTRLVAEHLIVIP